MTVVDTSSARPQDYLGALGTTGLTAYAALTRVAPVREGDVVFISAAAGAVGSVAGQLARKLGASRVIGSGARPRPRRCSTTSDTTPLSATAGRLGEQLAQAAPEGIDVYLDSVGGDHLQAAITAIRPGGRIALVGAISGYNTTEPARGPDNLFQAAAKEVTLRGMLVSSYFTLFPEWIGQASGRLADGTLRTEETVTEGIEEAPGAFLGMMRGTNTGKALVRLATGQ
ncbi:NADP-dependent oxidoreductase [Streptomyces syringium]|uniref:NADP-dependent oxidoreductase n=1 Tax=Streptomyces syringium TaxID=76729 RepID=UPI0033ABECC8